MDGQQEHYVGPPAIESRDDGISKAPPFRSVVILCERSRPALRIEGADRDKVGGARREGYSEMKEMTVQNHLARLAHRPQQRMIDDPGVKINRVSRGRMQRCTTARKRTGSRATDEHEPAQSETVDA